MNIFQEVETPVCVSGKSMLSYVAVVCLLVPYGEHLNRWGRADEARRWWRPDAGRLRIVAQ